ncbi:hypothetical protein [Glaciihabitans arcticus]|uniref:hypothetical protein n=1 Tax=Glaciihabitans arcticus TaxID=2668039 RepID=UPI0012AB31DF|nr:hypothetical protein [Glaciihabitans arcticus]
MKRALLLVAALLLTGCTAAPEPEPTATAEPPQEYTVAWVVEQSWVTFSDSYPDVERPEVEAERLISPGEWPKTIAGCLVDAGFTDTKATTGGQVESASSGEEDYDLAQYVCSATFPIDPKYFRPLDEEAIGIVYDYFVDTLVPCLTAQGQTVTPAPTREAFLAGWEGVPSWNPYGDLPLEVIGQAELDRLISVCPEYPPDEVLYD